MLQVCKITDFLVEWFRQTEHCGAFIGGHEITTLSKRCHYDYNLFGIKKSIFILTSVISLDIIQIKGDITMKNNGGDCMNAILTIRPPDELRNLIRATAKRKGLTVNALVLQILWDWIKAQDKINRGA